MAQTEAFAASANAYRAVFEFAISLRAQDLNAQLPAYPVDGQGNIIQLYTGIAEA
jgi:hypothetical protein